MSPTFGGVRIPASPQKGYAEAVSGGGVYGLPWRTLAQNGSQFTFHGGEGGAAVRKARFGGPQVAEEPGKGEAEFAAGQPFAGEGFPKVGGSGFDFRGRAGQGQVHPEKHTPIVLRVGPPFVVLETRLNEGEPRLASGPGLADSGSGGVAFSGEGEKFGTVGGGPVEEFVQGGQRGVGVRFGERFGKTEGSGVEQVQAYPKGVEGGLVFSAGVGGFGGEEDGVETAFDGLGQGDASGGEEGVVGGAESFVGGGQLGGDGGGAAKVKGVEVQGLHLGGEEGAGVIQLMSGRVFFRPPHLTGGPSFPRIGEAQTEGEFSGVFAGVAAVVVADSQLGGREGTDGAETGGSGGEAGLRAGEVFLVGESEGQGVGEGEGAGGVGILALPAEGGSGEEDDEEEGVKGRLHERRKRKGAVVRSRAGS